jgi:hypothetical protein
MIGNSDASLFLSTKDFASVITIKATGKTFDAIFDYETDIDGNSKTKSYSGESQNRYPRITVDYASVKDLEVASVLIINGKEFKTRNAPEFVIDGEFVEIKLSDATETKTLNLPQGFLT